ncbi:hypothetical protein SAMN04488120_10641 [Fontimonas thermophila]|uniref:Uncharacterized protein n=1 Tax=Fontimonas thermophila TaxID=1076937 RepID=A0A1I2J9R6_9GAMM|nr:hypothetical protein [Fontimonas thermophila]SFF50740.1 hypothetical protein SAMN04488120_10641 [Fontimonas thermophila]
MNGTVSMMADRIGHRRLSVRRVRAAFVRMPMLLLYGLFGLAGAALWVIMHLPVGTRARDTLVYAMAGCIGMFTLGWRLLRAQARAQD